MDGDNRGSLISPDTFFVSNRIYYQNVFVNLNMYFISQVLVMHVLYGI